MARLRTPGTLVVGTRFGVSYPARVTPSELVGTLNGSDGVLFLCSGNIIRSAFAELYARHLGVQIPVRSAGTTYPNRRIHPEARSALLDRGVSPQLIKGFRPHLISALDPQATAGELVFGMTRAHLREGRNLGLAGPSFLITELVSSNHEIADPYFEGGFDEVFDDLAHCVEALARAIG